MKKPLIDALKSGTEPEKYLGVQSLISQGFSKENRLQKQEHPDTEYIPYHLKKTLDFLIPLCREKLQNFFGAFLQFLIGVDKGQQVIWTPHLGRQKRQGQQA